MNLLKSLGFSCFCICISPKTVQCFIFHAPECQAIIPSENIPAWIPTDHWIRQTVNVIKYQILYNIVSPAQCMLWINVKKFRALLSHDYRIHRRGSCECMWCGHFGKRNDYLRGASAGANSYRGYPWSSEALQFVISFRSYQLAKAMIVLSCSFRNYRLENDRL